MVGKGAFGKVRIVERKDTGLTFALKYIRKEEGGSRVDGPSMPSWEALTSNCSGSLGERAKYHSRTENARASKPPLPVQLAVQFSGYGIHVGFGILFSCRAWLTDCHQLHCG